MHIFRHDCAVIQNYEKEYLIPKITLMELDQKNFLNMLCKNYGLKWVYVTRIYWRKQ